MKIGIVGCGMVGSTSAYALLMSGIGREIVLVDVNRARAEAEANDISHAVPFAHPLTVRAGEYADLADHAREALPAAAAQQRVEFAELAALAFVAHPAVLARIPAARAVEQEEAVLVVAGEWISTVRIAPY